jgi:methylthioribose-1-phosphate isomerase
MKIDGVAYRTIWCDDDGWSVRIIDQTRLPHHFEVVTLTSLDAAAQAIRTMMVRGAPLIGATAAYGMALAMRDDASDTALEAAYETLIATRPTAVNLRWALDDMRARLRNQPRDARVAIRPAGQCADPLQRRVAGHGRLGHRAVADLQSPRSGHTGACLGR